jgi:hypothetical protein
LETELAKGPCCRPYGDPALGRYKPSPDTLSGAHLENADLDNSHLEEIFLDGAHFEDAAVDGTHFDNAHEIKKAHFKGAEADIRTVWPAGFDPAKAGVETIQRDISSEWEGIS